MASDWLGVCVGSGSLLTPSPTWSRLDTGVAGLRVSGISIQSGRTSEFDETGTGTCTVTFNDRNGVLDPTNGSNLISKPFAVSIRNPVTNTWWPLFRGSIDECGYGLTKHQLKEEVAIVAVDAFDYFSNFEMIPGLAGFANAEVNNAGYVFYEDAAWDDRIFAILGDCNWPTLLSSIFSGNIIVRECTYSPGDTIMQALREAVDAEFPGIANMYVDKRGHLQAHGRYARFDPVAVAASASDWDFNTWKVGDNANARADLTRAKLQPPFTFQTSRKMVRNAALAYPADTDRSDLPSYILANAASRTAHGTRTWLAENLQVQEGTTTGNNAKNECLLYSRHIIDNYGSPVPRISELTVGTEHPTHDVFGAAAWKFICEVNISDLVNVLIGHPGGGGFNDDYYIEGLSYEIRPGPGTLDASFPFVKLSCDVSPAVYWATSPFGPFV